MNNIPWLAAVMFAGAIVLGCQNPDTHSGVRQEGDLATRSLVDLLRGPYSPILGDTTGDGLPRDMRTGGGINGFDVTVYDRLKAGQSLPPADLSGQSPTSRIPPPPAVEQQP